MEKVLLIEDHFLVRMSLRLMLRELNEGLLVAEAGTFNDALDQIRLHRFDLIILDVVIPGGKGSQMIGLIRQQLPEVTILVCSSVEEDLNAGKFMIAGANGFLPKAASKQEALAAISTVMSGQNYFSERVQNSLSGETPDQNGSSASLSAREKQVMDLMIEGNWTKEIAHILNINPNTVSTYKARIFEKMQVNSVIELFKKINARPVE